MSTSRFPIHVFCPDEDPHLDTLQALRNEFDAKVTSIQSGLECVKSSDSKLEAKAVLLIVDDESRNVGLELCRHLKASEDEFVSEVIVLDRPTTIEEKIEIYDAGVSDLIIFPCENVELFKRVSLAIFRASHIEETALQAKSAMETAMSAIMDAGEMGSVIHFMRDSFNSRSIEHLADQIVESAIRFGLSSSVQIRTSWESINRTSSDSISPLEIQMLNALQNAGRIHQKGKRLLLNFGPISQIIKNLPEEDEYKCGRLRDHLALILEGANSRLHTLIATEEMRNLMVETNESIRSMHERQSEQKKQNVKIMDEFLEEIQGQFFSHGLTEDQETILLAMIDRYIERIFSTYEQGLKVDEEMAMIAERLKRSLEKVSTF
jgi:DNA-binding response OmpR family regulator